MAEEGKKGEQPIIVKKIKKGGHGHHGGAWKVAYADFVTAMMAFFIVMWILAAGQDVQNEVASYFQDPGLFKFIEGKTTVPIDLGLKPKPGKKVGDSKGEGEGKEKADMMVGLTKEQQDSVVKKVIEQAKQDSVKAAENLKETAKSVENLLKELAKESKNMKDLISSIKFEFTKEGLRIQLMERQKDLFFKSGSSELQPEAKIALLKIAKEIGKLPNLVEIEGHTDGKAYRNNAGFTNWELSSNRANSTRRALAGSGFWDGQVVKVTGFADQKPLIKENPLDPSNRRVTILVKNLNTEDIVEEELGTKSKSSDEEEE
jgi:chemotaxis protein MotB